MKTFLNPTFTVQRKALTRAIIVKLWRRLCVVVTLQIIQQFTIDRKIFVKIFTTARPIKQTSKAPQQLFRCSPSNLSYCKKRNVFFASSSDTPRLKAMIHQVGSQWNWVHYHLLRLEATETHFLSLADTRKLKVAENFGTCARQLPRKLQWTFVYFVLFNPIQSLYESHSRLLRKLHSCFTSIVRPCQEMEIIKN